MLGLRNVSIGIAPAFWSWPLSLCHLSCVTCVRVLVGCQGSTGLGAWPCQTLLAGMFIEALGSVC